MIGAPAISKAALRAAKPKKHPWKSRALLREEARLGYTYEVFRAAFLSTRRWCQALDGGVAWGCPNRSEEVHHRLGRGQGGALMDEANTVALCVAHHREVTQNPAEARRLGLSQGRWKT